MKKTVMLFALLLGLFLGAQDGLEIAKKEKDLVFGTNLSIGRTIIPDKGTGLSFALEFKNKSLFGFGVLLNSGSYESLNLNKNPPLEDIENYNSETDDPFRGLNYVDGSTKDRFMMNAVYLSKGYKLNKDMIIDIQVGPSLNIFRRQKFTYRYHPPFGSFSGSSPSSFFAKSSESKLSIIGLNLRGCIYYSLNTNTVISFAPYVNFNRETNIFGLHIGFVFGKKYKRNLFND